MVYWLLKIVKCSVLTINLGISYQMTFTDQNGVAVWGPGLLDAETTKWALGFIYIR